jgi:hypothetical protein
LRTAPKTSRANISLIGGVEGRLTSLGGETQIQFQIGTSPSAGNAALISIGTLMAIDTTSVAAGTSVTYSIKVVNTAGFGFLRRSTMTVEEFLPEIL